ncbi:hypothetical protein IWW34DRAFT_805554 [Fusarium oxysporum f. sp. albedinis]|nr:hypothetical protein IWW34DRAFT_805554 [Fusarium oxysporum f. sp. albedinis]
MATNSPTVMPRINISYSIFVQFLSKINKGIFRDASIDALGKIQKVHQAQSRFLIWYPDLTAVVLGPAKPPSHRYPSQNEIDELLGDLRSVSDFLFDTEHRFCSGQENERNMLKPLEELAINKLNPYRGPKDIYGIYHGVLVTPSWPKLTKRMAPVGLRNR